MGAALRLAGVIRESIVDGPGIRFVVFCQGCPHRCPGCHNAETHDFSGGYDCDIDKILAAVDANPLLQGVTFSGGEPACQPAPFYALAKEIKHRGLNVWMYTGYTLEELSRLARSGPESPCRLAEDRKALRELLDTIDVLVDGKYIEAQRDLTLRYRGSTNQRVIDMNRTRETGTLTLTEY